MENLNKKSINEVKKVLMKDDRLVSDDDKLLKNKASELARKLDEDLIKLLFKNKETKKRFFKEVDDAVIFDQNSFISFIYNKDFLPDSYTSFKNKIGLTTDKGDFISQSGEVVLSWPYKDCVLEGGQTKEDQKRDEIFWNEILAPDEITRLKEPKVFTDWKRIDKDGENEVKELKEDDKGVLKENLVIQGNNLLALHSLKERFASKVKLIYIDPPYNTGGSGDTFTYNNNFNHSTWLTFMKNRLEVAKNFLRKDGFIAITIDHNELLYLGALADELFGRKNRVGIVTIVHKPEGRNQEKFFGTSNEFMVVYARDKNKAEFRNVVLDEELKKTFNKEDKKGKYKLKNFIRLGGGDQNLKENKPNFFYPIYVSKNLDDISLKNKKGYFKVLPITSSGQERTWKTIRDTFKERLDDGEIIAKKDKEDKIQIYEKYRENQVIKTHWTQSKYHAIHHGTNLLEDILGEKSFSYPKSLYAVLDTLKLMTNKEDVIMDFFAGSGTTGHATLNLNKEDGGERKFILVEQLKDHINVCEERLKKVIKNNNSGSFIRADLQQSNEEYRERIKKAKKSELKDIWNEIKKNGFLSWQVDIKKIDKNAKEFADLKKKDMQKFLLDVLDNNHLYVNYSDIDDNRYEIEGGDKKLNKEFYGK